MALSTGAYQAEILRGAFNTLPSGQAEAAAALGFSGPEIWRRILLPQALRISVPPLINEFILILKASSLVSVVGIAELTRVSMNIASLTYRPLEAYVGGGLFYLAINLCLAAIRRDRRTAACGGRGAMNPDVLWRYAPSLVSGFGVTVMCWGAGGALGLLLGFIVSLLYRLPFAPLRWLLRALIEVFRGTPFLMQLFLLYAGGPYIGLEAQRDRGRRASDSGFIPPPISPRSSAAASPPCRTARPRRR